MNFEGNSPVGDATAPVKQETLRGRRADYAHFRVVPTRWMDNDIYGHLNNVVYYSLFDTAVNSMLIEDGLLDPQNGSLICLVVETGCRYFESVHFPETLEAGIRVARLGKSSVRYEIGIFREGSDEAAAEGFFVHVCVDRDTRRPVAFSSEYRAVLGDLSMKENA
jgi:acyl-CoA thioester hydrolase